MKPLSILLMTALTLCFINTALLASDDLPNVNIPIPSELSSKDILTDKDARAKGVGGELIGMVW